MLKVYGLLHIQSGEASAMNLKVSDLSDQISVYVGNALALSNSLRAQSISFCLLTNCKNIIDNAVFERGSQLDVVEIPFQTSVPSGARFYSAHFKIDAFRYLATLGDKYIALCDLDVLCINPPNSSLMNIVKSGMPIVYDISDQVVPVFGPDTLVRDLSILTGRNSEGRWFGGEFIAGSPSFFQALVSCVDKIWPIYTANINTLHHVGDEAVVSAALDVMRSQGMCFCDGGTLGLVGRYWSSAVLHPQRSFRYFRKGFLLHMPSDKRFLNQISFMGILPSSRLLSIYTRHLVKSLPRRLLGNVINFLRYRTH